MTTKITYYNPRTKQTLSQTFEEGWRAKAFVDKLRAERKPVRKVETITIEEPTINARPPENPDPAA